MFGLAVLYGVHTNVANDADDFGCYILAAIDIEFEFGDDDPFTDGLARKVAAARWTRSR